MFTLMLPWLLIALLVGVILGLLIGLFAASLLTRFLSPHPGRTALRPPVKILRHSGYLDDDQYVRPRY